MGIFSRKAPEIEPDVIAALTKRVAALEEANHQIDKDVKGLELDWREWFDKFRLLYARLAKRIREAASPDEDAPQSPQDAPRSTIPRAVGYDRPYSPQGGPKPKRNY